ncbi:ASCH domain-containing protein [Clostridium disporicum]|uniref:ASCH domain-containing protein n=1 Tax=Clostridium disporicum TaxID=84024 RepID=UPI0034A58FDD
MKGLIIKPYWADLILNNETTMELRGGRTKIRGTIGIIKSKTGQVYGEVDIIDCIPLSKEEFNQYRDKHKVTCTYEEIPYKTLYGWVLDNVKVYDKPIPYKHKQGCVIWVNIEEEK